jgi:chromatin remodeling complex protein RSC6
MMKDVDALTEDHSIEPAPKLKYREINQKREEKLKQSDEYADVEYEKKYGKRALNERKRELERVTKSIKVSKRRKTEKADSSDATGSTPKKSGFTRPMALSEELAAFLGTDRESRTQVSRCAIARELFSQLITGIHL